MAKVIHADFGRREKEKCAVPRGYEKYSGLEMKWIRILRQAALSAAKLDAVDPVGQIKRENRDRVRLLMDSLARESGFEGFALEPFVFGKPHLRVEQSSPPLLWGSPEARDAFEFLLRRNVEFCAVSFGARFMQLRLMAGAQKEGGKAGTAAYEAWVRGLVREMGLPEHEGAIRLDEDARRIIFCAESLDAFFENAERAARGEFSMDQQFGRNYAFLGKDGLKALTDEWFYFIGALRGNPISP